MVERTATLALLVTLSACTSSTGTQHSGYVAWDGSDDSLVVLDAAGERYRFATADGCLISEVSSTGPADFCLGASSTSDSGFATYGATSCGMPTANPECNSASFDVVLTADPASPTGCIAVLGNGGATSVAVMPLSVTSVGSGYEIVTQSTATAYKTYWNGVVPLCNGAIDYAGTYTGTFGEIGYIIGSEQCSSTSNGGSGTGATMSVDFAIDTGGVIDDDTAKITGTIASGGTGSFTAPDLSGLGTAHCTPTFTITSATKSASGKWMLSGSYALASSTTTFTAMQD